MLSKINFERIYRRLDFKISIVVLVLHLYVIDRLTMINYFFVVAVHCILFDKLSINSWKFVRLFVAKKNQIIKNKENVLFPIYLFSLNDGWIRCTNRRCFCIILVWKKINIFSLKEWKLNNTWADGGGELDWEVLSFPAAVVITVDGASLIDGDLWNPVDDE